MKKLQDGVFTIRDMYEQFLNIQKLGPLSQVGIGSGSDGCRGWPFRLLISPPPLSPTCAFLKVMSMIPGFNSDILGGKAGEEASAARLRRCMVIMDSMADAGWSATTPHHGLLLPFPKAHTPALPPMPQNSTREVQPSYFACSQAVSSAWRAALACRCATSTSCSTSTPRCVEEKRGSTCACPSNAPRV